MSDEPKAVTLEQLDVFHNLIQYYAADARCTSLDEVRSGCLYKIAAIEAVLNERDKLKADVERLREWESVAHELAARLNLMAPNEDFPPVTSALERFEATRLRALAAIEQTNDTPGGPEPAADRLGWFAWRDTVNMAIQTDEARVSIKVTAGTEKEALALRAECFLLLEPLVRAIEPSANDTKGKR